MKASVAPAAETRLPSWTGWILGAWAVFAAAAYFLSAGHPLAKAWPFIGEIFTPGSSTADWAQRWKVIGRSFLDLSSALGILGATRSLGRRIRKWLFLEPGHDWLRLGFDLGLGMAAMDLFWMGTGLTGLWFPALEASFGAALLFLFLWDMAHWGDIGEKIRSLRPPGDPGLLFLAGIGALYWIFALLQGLAPETFYDSMVYHLAVPADWLLRHGMTDLPGNFFSNYPYGGEFYFLNGLALQGTEAAKLLHVFLYGAGALFAGGWAWERAGREAGWLALGLVLTFPLFSICAWSTAVEGVLVLALLLFAYSLGRLGLTPENRGGWALALGLSAGLAFSVKYTALLAVVGLSAAFLFQRPRAFGKAFRSSWLPLLGAAALLGLPWIVKNLAYTGNPFFPYFMSFFHGRHLTAFGYQSLLREQQGWVTDGPGDWWKLPWILTMGNPDSFDFCGPLALALVPALLGFRWRDPSLRLLAWAAPLIFLAGLCLTHILRFSLFGFVALDLLLGAGLYGGNRPAWGKAAAWFAGAVGLGCFAYLAAINHYYDSPAGIWTGSQTREQYLEGRGRITPYEAMAEWINQNTPKDAGLLVVGDARGLYYGRPFRTNSVFDAQDLARAARESTDAGGVALRLKEMGVDDLAVNGLEGIRVSAGYHHYDLTPAEWQRLDDFIQTYTEPVYASNLQAVYRILPGPKTKPGGEVPDLVLFFSGPASRFVREAQEGDLKAAGEDLREVLKLYPFSSYWKRQAERFEKALRGMKDR
jgi:4-amino-4-deoxy-L-arabinose transferase-like glycosyltransferase